VCVCVCVLRNCFFFRLVSSICSVNCFKVLGSFVGRQKTRLQISELVKNTSAKLKEASEADLHGSASVSKCLLFCFIPLRCYGMLVSKRTFSIEPVLFWFNFVRIVPFYSFSGRIVYMIDDMCILVLMLCLYSCSKLRR